MDGDIGVYIYSYKNEEDREYNTNGTFLGEAFTDADHSKYISPLIESAVPVKIAYYIGTKRITAEEADHLLR